MCRKRVKWQTNVQTRIVSSFYESFTSCCCVCWSSVFSSSSPPPPPSFSGITLSLLVERLTITYSCPLEFDSVDDDDDGISFWLRLLSCRDTAVSNSLSLFSSWSESLSSSSLPILFLNFENYFSNKNLLKYIQH